MNKELGNYIYRISKEPPFRIIVKEVLKRLNISAKKRATWQISKRPQYLISLLAAADQAVTQGCDEISAIEFGVAGGNGLIALQEEAESVEKETGIKIKVFGFDMGIAGLPDFIGDFRDHPDAWKPGDFSMDEAKLRARLTERTKLIIGNVKETVDTFCNEHQPPTIGFISFDMDLYSSTIDALRLFENPNIKMLMHTPLYFDDIEFIFNHKFAGELLAIDEFNSKSKNIKIDRWYGVEIDKPFYESYFYKKLYVAHDIEAISKFKLDRDLVNLEIK